MVALTFVIKIKVAITTANGTAVAPRRLKGQWARQRLDWLWPCRWLGNSGAQWQHLRPDFYTRATREIRQDVVLPAQNNGFTSRWVWFNTDMGRVFGSRGSGSAVTYLTGVLLRVLAVQRTQLLTATKTNDELNTRLHLPDNPREDVGLVDGL